ncbi:type II toxin-antitoxin system RelE/ParE family toxin [Avibacterium paragallinarum]|uniref:type II toxin-antitoxin system RelE/ParE family toxin n=1 Tax=Avibacterium paragallinarum TaxID=728 RepID=UPI0010AA3085|nr:type II toxin-antitoxin system RelE/ParE family toxin [Avibacterium paragallinarum]QJE09056.1 type II toxin-antitoxin system RelE/ParE family toxin [Avibacterium paragallinarum]QJE11252.1 type II toxin-antitoxin system RelE/ParE family toxin [Avibacterium paragallinarum]QJE13449.1 type II toxin-antitoxin system RelE/ParE family toxin [Avibacterium paragallinarum]QJE15649.1 type II toxin-antitoxin system RelE/ParE family toxin [Avibacterium paragallinarum]QJE17846.1 type II toxin-antitoxin s
MIQIKSTTLFKKWLDELKDLRARAKIQTRIKRLQLGNFGDVKPVGEGISELRITEGKGYRIYLKNQNGVVVILLCAGDKSIQSKDIEKAKLLAKELGV